ncbi:MAG: bifunctional pyr operon transcriptional regulator/uracil phosphoribosyltransferase PyrR, partial [Firmicutes bacterium]|nr:bifunctional pyr operon transcriptional regulator/uracil phosphoribosyltransferase PyrR [Bacillota bacterium]
MENIVMNNETLKRTLRRLSYEIIEKHKNLDDIVLMGIKKKGVIIAEIIAGMIENIEGKTVEHVDIDISGYRDDLQMNQDIEINKENIKIDLNNKTIILTDDVLYTGRTVRAAMDAIIDLGRPRAIELLIL